MPDTGAPWNIPYADPTDLVRDWPDLSEDVAEAVAAGLSAAGNAGIGSNVVQTVKTDVFSTTSTSNTLITGLTATITPTSATSKVLVIVHLGVTGNSGATEANTFQLFRGATAIASPSGGSQPGTGHAGYPTANSAEGWSMMFLDSPETTAATTYEQHMRVSGGTGFINRWPINADRTAVSSLTLIEVAP